MVGKVRIDCSDDDCPECECETRRECREKEHDCVCMCGDGNVRELTPREYDKHRAEDEPPSSVIIEMFGSWEEALEEAADD